MKQKKLSNPSVQEGIIFLLLAGALLYHSLSSHAQGFNQDWSQSPYLFPLAVSFVMAVLALTLIYQGLTRETAQPDNQEKKHTVPVLIILSITLAYYVSLALLKIPYITFGLLSWSLTISNFEIMTVVFLIVMMLYLGVRKLSVLLLVPVGTSLFLSVTFRAMLHVLLP